MNILRLVVEERERKKRNSLNPEFAKLEEEALSSNQKPSTPQKFNRRDLRERLTPVQFTVTQHAGTEKPFTGQYNRKTTEGVYSCLVCDLELFTSSEKFESSCGWPAFSDVIERKKVVVLMDTSQGQRRLEVKCSECGAHLGHVFSEETGKRKIRYCINSAALLFKRRTTV